MIDFFSESIEFSLSDSDNISNWILDVATIEGKVIGDLSYIFCDDSYLLNINKEYLDHDYFTDIITFDYTEDNIISGDIFISIDRVKENAHNLNLSFIDELHRVIIHGVLHLCGYKDKTEIEASTMRQLEDNSLTLRTF